MERPDIVNLKITGIEIDKKYHCVKADTLDEDVTIEWDAIGYTINLFEKGRAIHIRKKEANLLFEKMSRFCRENFNISMSLYYAGKTEEDIGSCTLISGPDDKKEYAIEKAWFGQGWVFKSFKNYMEKPDAPCYVAKLTDEIYTANDILKLCRNQKSFADQLFGE